MFYMDIWSRYRLCIILFWVAIDFFDGDEFLKDLGNDVYLGELRLNFFRECNNKYEKFLSGRPRCRLYFSPCLDIFMILSITYGPQPYHKVLTFFANDLVWTDRLLYSKERWSLLFAAIVLSMPNPLYHKSDENVT